MDGNITVPVIHYGKEWNLDVELDLGGHSNDEAESSINDADDNIDHEDVDYDIDEGVGKETTTGETEEVVEEEQNVVDKGEEQGGGNVLS